jgi:SAM-dependent methyltransferase
LDTRARFVAEAPASGALLDMGSSDGETLGHIAEMRPDLRLYATDMAGQPARYPAGCEFQRADLEREKLRWPDQSMDAITCMHLIEHMHDLVSLLTEAARLLKRGGRIYFETPHPKTLSLPSPRGAAAGTFTLNFFDDLTHVRPVAVGALAQQVRAARLEVEASGTSRNWLFAAAWPLFAVLPPSRKKFTSRVHWLGWSAFLIARRPL